MDLSISEEAQVNVNEIDKLMSKYMEEIRNFVNCFDSISFFFF